MTPRPLAQMLPGKAVCAVTQSAATRQIPPQVAVRVAFPLKAVDKFMARLTLIIYSDNITMMTVMEAQGA